MSSICKTIFSLIFYNLEEIKQVIRAKRKNRIIIIATIIVIIVLVDTRVSGKACLRFWLALKREIVAAWFCFLS